MTDTRQIEPSQFDGVDLATMRAWVENGSAQGLYDSADAWKAQETYLRELRSRLDDKLKEVGVVMQSESGEALQNQAVPIALWTEVAADNSLVQSELLRDQGEAFKKVQTSIPGKGEEQEIPDNNWFEDTWDSLVNGQTDAEAAKEHNEKLRQEAVQAFQTYDSTSQSTVASSAVFTPPPENGVKVAVSGSQHPSVGAVPTVSGSPSGTTSQWAGGSSAGSTTVPAGHTGGAGGVGTGGGAGGTGGGGGFAGTNPVWQRPGQNTPGRPGTGRVPGGPGTGGPGVPGVPGGGIPGTGGGAAGAGAGGRGGVGAGGAGGRGAGALGAGGRAGAGGLGAGGTGTGSASGGAGGAGGRGGVAGAGAAGARPQGKQGEEDQEHETPDYLKGDHGFFDEGLPKVAPPVFGDWDQR